MASIENPDVALPVLRIPIEGIFRQHMMVKGRNRDTAWFSIVDSEPTKPRSW